MEQYTAEGDFVRQWGETGVGAGQFDNPYGVAVDHYGDVFVADTDNSRVQKFTSEGQFVTEWGALGNQIGRFNRPFGLTVSNGGWVYVCDTLNNRIQKFRPVLLTDNSKAIIVAGGGPFAGNHLWEASQMCANFAYRALTRQGFTKETIYYLSANTDLDLDDNGEADDVDAEVTNANLQHALEMWAPEQLGGLPTGDVFVYLTDHGGPGTFRMSGGETLELADLAAWLDTLQAGITGHLTLIYDACESGTFLETLAGPGRTIITSTATGENAYFVTQGTVSFSMFFWVEVFNGLDVAESFLFGTDALGQAIDTQTPLIDADGNGTPNEPADIAAVTNVYIGKGVDQFQVRPVIGGVSADPALIEDGSTATLTASDVTDPDGNGISRVWAVIRPPNYQPEDPTNPVLNLPQIELFPATGDDWAGATPAST